MNQPVTKYTKFAILLHWLIGLLIIAMLAFGLFMSEIPKDLPDVASIDLFNWGVYTIQLSEPQSPRAFYFNLHKSIGITLLALILIRVYWRLTHAAPAFPDTMKRWEKMAADWSHKLLYALMVIMPVSGFLMTTYSKYGLKWFGIRVTEGLDNEPLREIFKEVHEFTAFLLIAFIVVHILAAIKHKVIDKDEVMSRMSLH